MHLLNKLMHPPQTLVKPRKTFLDALRGRPGYKVFTALLVDTGIVEFLLRPLPYTVFAPTDEAFGKVPNLAELLRDEKRLRSMLFRHICAGRFDLRALGSVARLRNIDGVTEQRRAHTSLIQDASIVEADIRSWNGLLHGIDQVLVKETGVWTGAARVPFHENPYAEPTAPNERFSQTQRVERAILKSLKSVSAACSST